MKRFLFCILIAALVLSFAPSCTKRAKPDPVADAYRSTVDRIREAGLSGERAYRILTRICSVGPRLTG